jgi:AraC-like DNA-binding protein
MVDELVNQLRRILEERKLKNNRYSVRAFARDLKISASCLSRTLNGHTELSTKNRALIEANLHKQT